jgi:hypothetical protein
LRVAPLVSGAARRSVPSGLVERPGAIGVLQVCIQDVPQITFQRHVHHRAQDFDLPIQVSLHQIGAADQDRRITDVLEPEDPRMFEKASDDRPDRDAVAGEVRQRETRPDVLQFDALRVDACIAARARMFERSFWT